jgi:protein phosphatase PTC2/3
MNSMCFFKNAVGIWDCLSSQQVVDFIRYRVYEGKELSEICEMIFDHCLSPDTSNGAGIGCDNMTILIVAILNGRTKEEWYAWITDRVKKSYGYDTPSTPPQLYSEYRINAYRARKAAMDARERERAARQETKDDNTEGLLAGSGLSGFTKVLSTTGGISFTPDAAAIMSDDGRVMFATEESDDDEDSGDGDEESTGQSVSSDTPGFERPKSPDLTKNLKDKLDEFEKDIQKEAGKDDGDSQVVDAGISKSDEKPSHESNSLSPTSDTRQSHVQGEAPPPPKPLPNGNASAPVAQLNSHPHGDEPLAVVKAEGLMDSSEDPLVKA